MTMIRISGYDATVVYDDEIEMFRGEFIALNGGADFYADNVLELREQGEISIRIFLETCKEKGIEPQKAYSGKFQVRVSPDLHARAAAAAAEHRMSLNQYVAGTIEAGLATRRERGS